MICGIYIIKNKKNDKVYIGQSIDIKKRWCDHKRKLDNNSHYNTHLQNAWNKYGSDSFSFEIIKACKPRYLDRFEKLQIYLNKSMNPKYGYNKESGGNSQKQVSEETKAKISAAMKGENNYLYGKHLLEETKAKISESMTGKTQSEETRAKRSKALKGIKRSDETKAKISEARTGKPLSEETKAKLSKAKSKYTLWNAAKCSYNKAKMISEKRDGSEPSRCFQTRYHGKKIKIGYNMDFISCEIIHDMIEESM